MQHINNTRRSLYGTQVIRDKSSSGCSCNTCSSGSCGCGSCASRPKVPRVLGSVEDRAKQISAPFGIFVGVSVLAVAVAVFVGTAK